ncbi:MAG TPA: glutamine--fructose-6-phosphate transaminase (isomerizing) [Pirellulaceae bacterium]|nr:glutamine--fructose-6-phosphate transaminase (isomerizing) [Pirellulaceae bacterium]HMO92145.1 glutamine--fructose-6-phosphate transaminase (isomerizing) [Pirellulaceae bacterium]HMP68930.1 glutamine--fructose-6-phosphate transaminase (isomerizing) [Pirellulaceae bacterium]
MCGIVGYAGPRDVYEILLEGLKRLEYRGYDSAGTATFHNNEFQITRVVGRISGLASKLSQNRVAARIGIGHTRWATHGAPTEQNAHPHLGGEAELALVHNGVIENFDHLKASLIEKGYVFHSETDTEVIAHIIDACFQEYRSKVKNNGAASCEDGVEILMEALSQLRGTYGIAVVFKQWPDTIFAARLRSPLVIGIGSNEHFLASDAAPLIGHTEKIVYLSDNQLAMIQADKLKVFHRDAGVVNHSVKTLDMESTDVELGHFQHYMLKEIFEQPRSLRNTMRGRLCDDDATAVFGGLNLTPQELRKIKRIVFTACGTSWHSALVGEYLFEDLAQIPVEVEYASELRYRNPPMDDDTLIFAITQSGETADTLAALREMKRQGHMTMAICNVVGSSIAQEADGGVFLHAGPEIGVASTKAYTSQCLALTMLALYFGRLRHLSYNKGRRLIEKILALPDAVEETLGVNQLCKQIAEKYADANNFLYLGRHYNFPTALEGALKLKEISYIHAEGYPAAEMKHGPIALVDEQTPSVFVMPQGFIYEKVLANLQEIKARRGPVIAVAAEGDDRISQVADDVIFIPQVDDFLQPIVTVIPLQLLAYHIAVIRGCDVDKPRNLAKSVTVE